VLQVTSILRFQGSHCSCAGQARIRV